MTFSRWRVSCPKSFLIGLLFLALLGMPVYAYWSSARRPPVEVLQAVQRGDVRSVARSIEEGADVNLHDSLGLSPLMVAIRANRFPVATCLIQHGANVNDSVPIYGTPLMQASLVGEEPIVELLLDNGASINLVNSAGHTALWYAVAGDEANTPTIRRLLHAGADPNIRSRDGETALGLAMENGDWSKARLLLESGASMSCEEANAGFRHIADRLNRAHQPRNRSKS